MEFHGIDPKTSKIKVAKKNIDRFNIDPQKPSNELTSKTTTVFISENMSKVNLNGLINSPNSSKVGPFLPETKKQSGFLTKVSAFEQVAEENEPTSNLKPIVLHELSDVSEKYVQNLTK